MLQQPAKPVGNTIRPQKQPAPAVNGRAGCVPIPHSGRAGITPYSHSIVAGGFEEMS